MTSAVQSVHKLCIEACSAQNHAALGLCSACITIARAYVRQIHNITLPIIIFKFYKYTFSRMHALHTPRMTYVQGIHGYMHAYAHTLHTLFFYLKNKMKYVTGKENTEFMRGLLLQRFPAFNQLAKELYQAGMIKGLRSLTIETDLKPLAPAVLAAPAAVEATYTCSDCRHFQADAVGSGAGIGACGKGVSRYGLLWPKQTACQQIGLLHV